MNPLRISLVCLALVTSLNLRAATIIKANNSDNLNLTTSWIGGVVPGPLDVARWDSNLLSSISVALGADLSWGGIIVTNPAGPVTITAGNILTLGTSGIDMGRATQSLTISSDLTLGPGAQRWNVTNGTTLTVNGTLTRSGNATLVKGSTLAAANQGNATANPTLLNDIVPWASVQSSGAATNNTVNGFTFATVSSGNIVAYTGATPETTSGTGVFFGGIPTGDNSTLNYDLGVASTGGSLASDLYVNSLRNTAGAYTQPGSANFRANAIMNSGTGVLIINTPVQQSDTNVNELVLTAWTAGITLSNTISDNVNPLRLTIAGTNATGVLVAGQNTFSGGVTINSGRMGIRANSTPLSGTVTSGPLGTNTVTLNGGILFASGAGYTVGNPIVVGPGGGQFQVNGASPDLTINGNITGSGTLTLAGVFNQNGLFLAGDNTAFNGTVIVTGSNNRLSTTNSGSALARWVVNGALQAQLVNGGTYHLGELSSTVTTGSLNGHAGNVNPSIQNFVVGALNTSSSFGGIIVDNSAGNAQTGNTDAAANNVLALTKVGSGTLTLTGANTYTGPTTISAGTLQLGSGGTTGSVWTNSTITLNGNLVINRNNAVVHVGTITGSGSFTQAGTGTTTLTAANNYGGNTVVSGGTLLVNGSITGTATVMAGAKLGGNGTIGGVVTVQTGGQLGAGATATTIGTLTLNNTPVLGGSVFAKVNAGTAQSDLITVTGGNPINYGGSLVVSNTGVPLLAGDTFTIFAASTHNGNFDSVVGSAGAGLAYSFTNGVLTVISTAAPYATNVTASVTNNASGKTMTIAWPPSHLGWLLQSQTNNADGSIKSDPAAWFDLPGSAFVTLTNLPINPSNFAVYFRMKYVAPPLPSGPPTGLIATATNHQVSLRWTAPPFARSYDVKRALTNGGPYVTIASVTVTNYVDIGLTNDVTYYYVVSAVNYNGETANSSEVSATPVAVPPLAPTGLTATAASGLVSLKWTAPASAISYNVKRATTGGGPYTTITNIAPTSFIDTVDILDGTTYYYVVSGLNYDGEGPNSSETNATPTAVPPVVPTGLTTKAYYTQVKVSWTGSLGATNYNVKIATTSGGPYTLATNVTGTSVYINGLTNGTTYYFVVSAVNRIGESADSSEASATPSSVPPLVYEFENTGGYCMEPTLPTLPLPGTFTLIQPFPDPFTWISDPLNIGGTRTTNFSDWECLRNEHGAEFEAYEIGPKPTVDIPTQVTASYSGGTTPGTSGTLTVRVTVGTNILTLTSAITIPAAATAPYPVCIGMNSSYGSLTASALTSRGIVGITFSHNQVTTYGSPLNTDPYYRLYGSSPYNYNTINTGQYSAWAWGVSRIIDGLTMITNIPVDLSHIMVTGCSYAGKMALFSGAFDERIALTIAQESGGGGATSWRYSHTEIVGSVESLENTSHEWFMEPLFQFGNDNVSYLPEDHHELMAMCAPRALYCTGNTDYTWLSNPSAYVVGMAAARTYETLGIGDRFGFHVDGGHGHCAFPAAQMSDLNYFLDKFMKGQTNLSQTIRTAPASFSTINYSRWSQWWGSTNAVLPP